MTGFGAMLRRGADGITATPVDFAHLLLPPSPNTCLAGPAGDTLAHRLEVPVFRLTPEALLALLHRIAATEPRTSLLADWPERRQAQWVARSRWMNYPDVIAAEAVERPGGASLRLYSRSLVGWSDLGVNRARLERWIAGLRAAAGTQAIAAS
jgi:uncharacterized protein (DUF1499 family)